MEVLHIERDRCSVRDAEGKEWEVASMSLDAGALVWIDGGWASEPAV